MYPYVISFHHGDVMGCLNICAKLSLGFGLCQNITDDWWLPQTGSSLDCTCKHIRIERVSNWDRRASCSCFLLSHVHPQFCSLCWINHLDDSGARSLSGSGLSSDSRSAELRQRNVGAQVVQDWRHAAAVKTLNMLVQCIGSVKAATKQAIRKSSRRPFHQGSRRRLNFTCWCCVGLFDACVCSSRVSLQMAGNDTDRTNLRSLTSFWPVHFRNNIEQCTALNLTISLVLARIICIMQSCDQTFVLTSLWLSQSKSRLDCQKTSKNKE